MGWDDDEEDEWDDSAIEAKLQAQLKEKEREKRREQGLPSDSEDEKPKEVAAASKPKEKKPKEKKVENKEPEKVLTAQEKKLLQRKLEEEQDARLAQDLFAGIGKEAQSALETEEKLKAEKEEERRKAASKPKVVVQDAFDSLKLTKLEDVEALAAICVEKLDKGTCKGGPGKFLVELLKLIEDALDMKEVTEIDKLAAELVKQKKAVKGTVTDAKASKANTKCTKTTKFNANDAWSEVYGGGDGDEEWTTEEWEAWEKQQALAAIEQKVATK